MKTLHRKQGRKLKRELRKLQKKEERRVFIAKLRERTNYGG